MATITQENIGLLHEKLTVKLEKTDYLPSFEKALKEYSKKANIPGFRKGMVPAGLIKKMYGSSLFTDEVLKTVDRELISHLQNEKFEIFAQPIPVEADVKQLDVNNPADYSFNFEIGMKPAFQLADLAKAKTTRYIVTVTDEMINSEVERLQNRYGNMKDLEAVDSEENVLNVIFSETDDAGNKIESGITKDNSLLVKYFAESIRKNWIGKKNGDAIMATLKEAFDEKERKWIISDLGLKETENAASKSFSIEITKIGQLEKRELNEDFYNQLYPGQEVKTESDFRNKIKEEIQKYWKSQSDNQIHDQAYHQLLDHTHIEFPEAFLKKWIKTQGDVVKEDEDVLEPGHDAENQEHPGEPRLRSQPTIKVPAHSQADHRGRHHVQPDDPGGGNGVEVFLVVDFEPIIEEHRHRPVAFAPIHDRAVAGGTSCKRSQVGSCLTQRAVGVNAAGRSS